MRYNEMLPFRAALVAGSLSIGLASAQASSGLTQEYCSSENTGADSDVAFNIYQSNGACYTKCMDNYAFAVVQYQNCWCSNYIPADQQDTGSCSQKCPGYPSDLCGDSNSGLFGYIKLNKAPLGTAGAASSTSTPTSSSTEEQTSSSVPPTTSSVSQASPQTTTSTSSPSTTESSVTPTPTSTSTTPTSTTPTPTIPSTTEPVVVSTLSSSATPTEMPSAVVTTRVITQSGAVVTQTVTSTPIVIPNQSGSNEVVQRQGLSGGAIAGIVIAILLALLAVAIGAFFLWRRHRQDKDAAATSSGMGNRGSPRRNVSVLSKAGLLRGNTDMAENGYDDNSYVNTGVNSTRHSMLFGAGGMATEGVSPVSPLGSSGDAESGNRRYSRPMVYDQRLNPSALFANQEANGSRVSIQDNADYSRSLGRTLGVMNPDPRASFESRA